MRSLMAFVIFLDGPIWFFLHLCATSAKSELIVSSISSPVSSPAPSPIPPIPASMASLSAGSLSLSAFDLL